MSSTVKMSEGSLKPYRSQELELKCLIFVCRLCEAKWEAGPIIPA